MIRSKPLSADITAAGLALLAGLATFALWNLDLVPQIVQFFDPLTSAVPFVSLRSPDSRSAAIGIVLFSTSVGLLVQYLGLRRGLPYLLGCLLLVVVICTVAAHFFAFDLLLTPLLIGGLFAVINVQLFRLWRADRKVTRALFDASANAQQATSIETTRLTSGLKLLDSVLPLNEAIVFQTAESNSLQMVARFKGSHLITNDTGRNAVWREGIRLCEQAIGKGKLVIEAGEDRKSSSVAVPLRFEHEIVGVLLIRLTDAYCDDDNSLLEAVGLQFARNLKRDTFSKRSPSIHPLSYFSNAGGQRKLEALYVLQALSTEQRCEANALTHIDDGVAVAYLDGTVALMNSKLLTYAGLSSTQTKSLDLFGLLDYFRTDVFDEPVIAVRRVLQTGVDYERELNFDQKNQILGLRISLLRAKEGVLGEGDPIGIVIYVRDLTRIKEYEKLKSDMISLMSHELRTPLTSINGFAELLTADDTMPEQAREFVTIIAGESQRMSRMINTFLAVTQLERKDKQEVLKIPLRLDEVVRETIASMQPIAKKKRIRLVEQPTHRIPPVAADKSLITQAVKNLLNNAIKYSPERTTVTVSTALEAEAVRVCVEDRGFGIPTESRDRVWEKFYRVVREGQEKDDESTGLGLSFVREVVEQHGGEVGLDSEVGRGSKFSFTLPRL